MPIEKQKGDQVNELRKQVARDLVDTAGQLVTIHHGTVNAQSIQAIFRQSTEFFDSGPVVAMQITYIATDALLPVTEHSRIEISGKTYTAQKPDREDMGGKITVPIY